MSEEKINKTSIENLIIKSQNSHKLYNLHSQSTTNLTFSSPAEDSTFELSSSFPKPDKSLYSNENKSSPTYLLSKKVKKRNHLFQMRNKEKGKMLFWVIMNV